LTSISGVENHFGSVVKKGFHCPDFARTLRNITNLHDITVPVIPAAAEFPERLSQQPNFLSALHNSQIS